MEKKRGFLAFIAGTVIGALGGLIGLGGAEFRLPVLIGSFGFTALRAVILNKFMSLIVVASALPFRSRTIPFETLLDRWDVILNLLAGSLAGAWFGAGWATRLKAQSLYRIIAFALVLIAAALYFGHGAEGSGQALVAPGALRVVAGIAAGFAIGVIASLLGVAGGELLIPTLVLLYGADVKLAGSLSLAISLPTMLVGFTRYSRDQSFSVIRENWRFALVMAAGSVLGTFVGGLLLGIAPNAVLLPLLSAILLYSAFKIWRHSS